MSAADRPLRPCAGVMLINRDGRVFVGRRAGVPEDAPAWQMPQGGIDPGESPRAAALRELWEETGVAPAAVAVLAEAPDWYDYEVPEALAEGARFKSKWRGQTQKWFALRFLGADADIDVVHPGGGAHKAEFTDWRWAEIGELADLVVPFKRHVYEQVSAAFAHLAVPA